MPAAPQPSPTTRRRWLRPLLISLGVLLAVTAAGLAYIVHAVSNLPDLYLDDDEPFDSARWKSTAPDDAWRESMLDDLRKNHLKPGLPKSEVVKLLGTPGKGDAHTCMGSLTTPGLTDTLCYTVSVGLDPCTFLVGFDSNGRYVESVKDCT